MFVAVGFFLDDNVLCYVDTNQTAAIGGTMTAERLAKAKAPWFSTDASDDLEVDAVRGPGQGRQARRQRSPWWPPPADKKLLDDKIQPVLDEARHHAGLVRDPGRAAHRHRRHLCRRPDHRREVQVRRRRQGARAWARRPAVVPRRPGEDRVPPAAHLHEPERRARPTPGNKDNDLSVLEGAVSGGRLRSGRRAAEAARRHQGLPRRAAQRPAW